MKREADYNKLQTTDEPNSESAGMEKKPYSTPILTEFGQMSEITKAGGGPGPNDGDYQLGSPLTS